MSIPSIINRLSRILLLLFVTAGLISGCADNGSSGSEDELGEKVYISLTDAAGDFTRYQVDVTGLRLYRASGSVIDTLPATTTLDFAQYVDVSEFLTTATVPVGYYTRAEITLDFSNAVLEVEDENGQSIPATAQDDNGDPLTSITLTTLINGSEGFAVRYGRPINLALDFDLEASNEVTINNQGDSATVLVKPVLVANTEIDDAKTYRLRGLLQSVDVDAQTFVVDIRPFRIRHHSFGEISVHSNNDTVFEVDGVSYDNVNGLRALDALDPLTPVVVQGHYLRTERYFLADEVYAGSSVPWDDMDMLKGSVIARSGNVLTVAGATIELDDGSFVFNDEVTVNLSDTTAVTRQGSTDPVDIGDLSVGQRVFILGDMVDDHTMDAATRGLVRMRYSDISGSVVTVSPLELDLQHINRRNVDRYDFTGTGTDSGNDADPAQYQVDTQSLSIDSLQQDAPVWVRGFPTPFGSAPMDFTARSIIDVSNLTTRMYMGYGSDGSATAIAALDDSGLLLDLGSTVGRHHLKQAGIVTDIHDLTSVPYLLPNDGHALYSISQGRRLEVFIRWQSFQDSLNQHLENGDLVEFAYAGGQYNSSTLELTLRNLVIRLND